MLNNTKNLSPRLLLYFAALSLVASKCPRKPTVTTDADTNQKVIQDTNDADDSGFESDGETAEHSAAEGKSPEGEDAENTKNQEGNGEDDTLTTEEKLAKAQEKIESLAQENEALQRRGSSGGLSVTQNKHLKIGRATAIYFSDPQMKQEVEQRCNVIENELQGIRASKTAIQAARDQFVPDVGRATPPFTDYTDATTRTNTFLDTVRANPVAITLPVQNALVVLQDYIATSVIPFNANDARKAASCYANIVCDAINDTETTKQRELDLLNDITRNL